MMFIFQRTCKRRFCRKQLQCVDCFHGGDTVGEMLAVGDVQLMVLHSANLCSSCSANRAAGSFLRVI